MKLSPKQFKKFSFVLVMTKLKFFTISFPNPPNQFGTVKNLPKYFYPIFGNWVNHFLTNYNFGPSFKAHQKYLKNVSRTHPIEYESPCMSLWYKRINGGKLIAFSLWIKITFWDFLWNYAPVHIEARRIKSDGNYFQGLWFLSIWFF